MDVSTDSEPTPKGAKLGGLYGLTMKQIGNSVALFCISCKTPLRVNEYHDIEDCSMARIDETANMILFQQGAV